MIILVRHGKTPFNDNGKEKIRSWIPLPLDQNGIKEAQQVAEMLSDTKDVKGILCSDLVRTVQTAHEIGVALNIVLTPREELRDINQGDWEGRNVDDAYLKDWNYHVDHPDATIPGGESVNDWIARYEKELRPKVESNDLWILIGHGKTSTFLSAYEKNDGEYPDMEILKDKPPIATGELMVIDKNWRVVYKSGGPANPRSV